MKYIEKVTISLHINGWSFFFTTPVSPKKLCEKPYRYILDGKSNDSNHVYSV